MNLFDLAGPPFLAAYAVIAAAVVGALALARAKLEGGEPGKLAPPDPYAVAYLKGGHREAVRSACASLAGRKLLKLEGAGPRAVTRVSAIDENAAARVENPLERAILERAQEAVPAPTLLADPRLERATERYAALLQRQGLRPDAAQRRARLARMALALAILWGVAGTKLAIALERGRHNVGFLIMFALVAAAFAARVTFQPRTARGDRLLSHWRELFEGLKRRVGKLEPRDHGYEIALLAGLYGIGTIPATLLPERKLLEPRRWDPSHAGAGAGATCGATCGSASASSCGSAGASSCGSAGGASCGSSCGSSCGGGCGGCGS